MNKLLSAVLFVSSIFAQNNLTSSGSPTFGASGCKFVNCVSVSPGNILTGSGSSLVAALNSNNWSIDFWLKATPQGGVKVYFSTDVSGGRPYAIWVGENGGTIQVSLEMSVSLFQFDTTIAPSGAWQHIAISMGGGTNLEVYVDGTRRVNATGTYNSPLATQIGIGRLLPAGGTYDSTAQIDELLIRTGDTFSGATITVPTAEYANTVSNSVGLYHLSNTTDSTGAGTTLTAGTLSSASVTSTSLSVVSGAITGGTSPYSSQLQQASYTSSCGSFTNIQSAATGATPSWSVTGLTPFTGYCFRSNITDAASGTVTSNTLIVTTSAASLYTRYDGVGPRGGQAVMALVPGSGSTIPYVGNPTDVVIYSHGAGETQEAWLTDSLKAGFIAPLINAGYILAGTNARGDNWGTQIATDDYADLWQYLKNNFNVRNVVILGQSMGGLTGANLISQGKIPNIRGFACIYCVFSLSNLHGLGSYTSTINTQHGITGSGTATYANMTAGLDPLVVAPYYAANYRFIGMRFYASPGDTVVPTAQNTDAFRAIIAPFTVESVKVTATGNHGDPSHFLPNDLTAFVIRRLTAPVFSLTGGLQ